MSTWTALNVEPDEATEEEIDDTKEIQIEEALKLYQTALKLHSQGSQFYSQAAEAYTALLNSDIFKYPESISSYKRSSFQSSESRSIEALEDAGPAAEPLGELDANDSTSSTLLQTIYLSYKNYGQYLLDSLFESLRKDQVAGASPGLSGNTNSHLNVALTSFAEALEHDDTDLNLWRKSARLCDALQSFKLSRYCLESVLADDENRLEARTEQLGLEETLAERRLQEILGLLYDRLSASQVPYKRPRKALLKFLERQTDPYPYLPALYANLKDSDLSKSLSTLASPRVITPTNTTWEAVGKAILQAFAGEQGAGTVSGSRVHIKLPSSMEDVAATPVQPYECRIDESLAVEDNTQQPNIRYDTDNRETSDRAKMTQASLESTPFGPSSTVAELDESSNHRLETRQAEVLGNEPKIQPESSSQQLLESTESSIAVIADTGGRKRSFTVVANDDHTEGMRTKSKRIRARESNADTVLQSDEVAFDHTKYYENRLEPFIYADEVLFQISGSLLSRIGADKSLAIEELRQQVLPACNSKDLNSASRSESTGAILSRDLRDIFVNWDEKKCHSIEQDDHLSSLYDVQNTSKAGLPAFLEHSRWPARKSSSDNVIPAGEELSTFLRDINRGQTHIHEVVFSWLSNLFMPGRCSSQASMTLENRWPPTESVYVLYRWSDTLKETVLDLLLKEDEYVYSRLYEQVLEVDHQILCQHDSMQKYELRCLYNLEMIQTVFELHLDICANINNSSSEREQGSKLAQQDRLTRWCMLARTCLSHLVNHAQQECWSNMLLRHLWASTFCLSMTADVQQEHMMLCLQDLKHSLGDTEIYLPNSTVMPQLSAAAVDQEVSRLRSMDFFMKIFGLDYKDPVDLIESIEPILEPLLAEYSESTKNDRNDSGPSAPQFTEMGSFLDRGDATLRLFLWRRLQDAYISIDYPPKVVSCYLRSIETIVKELQSASHLEEQAEHRQYAFIKWLRTLDDILGRVAELVMQEEKSPFECLDIAHLRSSISAIDFLSRLLHTAVLFEDSVRVGQLPAPDLRGSLAKSFEAFKCKLHEMEVRCWTLQYMLIREAIGQNEELFDTPLEDRINYLRALHNSLGVRSMCKYSKKQLPKLIMCELFASDNYDNHELDICQALFDIYGIKLISADIMVDHGCPAESLARATAVMIIDFVLRQATKSNIKDLSKPELKSAIDKVQKALGPTKSSPHLSYNRRILSTFLKSPINPADLVHAVRGVGDVSMIPVPVENAVIARKGWYFLLGHAALTRFRSQKRLSPAPANDLDEAIMYFRQDLEHATGRWESWYRLAQAYDSKLDEDITWSADKMNGNRGDLVVWQRYAIHCYTMAVATAIKSAEPTPKTRTLLSDLYSDFGIRMYASSREPLSMEAFSLADFVRHFNNAESHQMYKGKPFQEASLYFVWDFARYLLKLAVVGKPNNWMNYYMLGKCYWKMFSCDDLTRGSFKHVNVDDVLDSLVDAIDALPQRKDARADHIFEPHFKLVSIVHKLVRREILTPAEGSKTLLATPWARKVQAVEDITEWKPYILEVLKNLKNADKSNWHHRIVARIAHVLYDDSKDVAAAAAAKNELTHQIFTKTMTIQVWKPEFERPGRHFVFTTRYVYFFVSLLDQLDDRMSFDQLLRRVRKKQGDFINHAKLWEDICLVYCKVIRRAGKVSEGYEEGVFRPIRWEVFAANTARLESLPQLTSQSAPILELLRDAIELKRLNNHLMKVTPLEDLVADIYSRLYEMNIPQLVAQVNEENKGKMRVDHILMASDTAAETPSLPASGAASEAPAPRGRTKGIARRDIQKRAEAIVARRVAARSLPTVNAKLAAEPAASLPTAADMPESSTRSIPPGCAKILHNPAEESATIPRDDAPSSLDESADESDLSISDADEGKPADTERHRSLLDMIDSSAVAPEPEISVPASIDGDDLEEEADRSDGDGEDEILAEEGEAGPEDDGDGDEEDDEEAEGDESEMIPEGEAAHDMNAGEGPAGETDTEGGEDTGEHGKSGLTAVDISQPG